MPYPQSQSPFMQAYGSQQMQPQMGQGGQDQGWGKYLWEALFGGPGGIGEIGGNQQLMQQAMQQFMNPHEGFEPIRQNALRTFQSDIVPYLQGQFQSKGGGRSSSHFSSGGLQKNLYGAGATLADRLQAAQAQYGQNQQQNALSAINTAKPQYFQQQGSSGAIEPILRILAAYMGAPVPSGSGGGQGGGDSFQQLGQQIGGFQPTKLPWQQ